MARPRLQSLGQNAPPSPQRPPPPGRLEIPTVDGAAEAFAHRSAALHLSASCHFRMNNSAPSSTLISKTRGDNTHPCRSLSVTSNHSDCSPSSVRTRARMPSWNWRIMVSILYADACEHHPQQLSVDGVICFLEIDEAHIQRDSPSSSEFLQSAHDEQHVHC